MDKLKQKDERYYKIEGVGELPSVTTILSLLAKPALINWAVKVTIAYLSAKLDDIRAGRLKLTEENASQLLKAAKEYHNTIKEQAADLGKEAHNLIEVYLKGQNYAGLLQAKPELEPPFKAFCDWQKERRFELIAAEHIVYSKERRFAGTLDCVAKLDGKVYIVDFKTSNAVYKEYYLQAVAYKEAYEEMTESPVDGVGILRLGKEDGLPEWVEIPPLEWADYMDMFMCLCHYWHTERDKKKVNQKEA